MSKVIKHGDLGTPERHARGELRKVVRNGHLIAEKRRVSTHNTMLEYGHISRTQYDAAEKLWQVNDGKTGYKDGSIQERTSGGKHIYMADTQLDCMDAYNKAIKCLNSGELTLIVKVVINDKSPTSKIMKRSVQTKKMKQFKQALDKLAKYYGFT